MRKGKRPKGLAELNAAIERLSKRSETVGATLEEGGPYVLTSAELGDGTLGPAVHLRYRHAKRNFATEITAEQLCTITMTDTRIEGLDIDEEPCQLYAI